MVLCCSICLAEFTRMDTIWSTTCGHIYHEACMKGWRNRSQLCPQCRTSNIQVHQIFLDLEDDTIARTQVTALNKKLEQCNKDKKLLDSRLKDSENKYLYLQLENSLLIEENRNLKNELNDSDTNFMSLQSEFSELADELKKQAFQLEQRILSESTLEADLKEKENEVFALRLECSRLREDTTYLQSELVKYIEEKSESELRANESHAKLKNLQEDFSISTELLKNMNTQMNNMRKGNSYDDQEEIARLSIEKQKLNRKLHESRKKIISLKEDNEILEQKLRCVRIRLEQEIQNSVSASCEQMKLVFLTEKDKGNQWQNYGLTEHSKNQKKMSKHTKKICAEQVAVFNPIKATATEYERVQLSNLQPQGCVLVEWFQ